MERAGILHVNPSADLLPKQEDSIKRTLGITEGIYDIFGKHYGNKLKESEARLKGLEANKAERTLDSDVTAINTKNQADTKYYPQMQAAKLGHEQAQIKEVMARTGLSYAQAKVAMAHLPLLQAQTAKENRSERGESSRQAQLYQAYQNAPNGSEQKAYFGALLNKEMGAYAPSSIGGEVPPTPRGGGVPTGGSGLENNPLGAGNRSTFHQAYDPETGQTIESPTTSSATRNQQRGEAHAEIGKLYPKIMEDLKPYQGPMGSLALIKDSALAQSGNKKAMARLEKFATAKRFLPELANINARQSSGQAPGIEMNREFQDSMFPSVPGKFSSSFIPGAAQEKANKEYLPLQNSAVESAINEERQGYQQNGQVPPWAQQGGKTRGGFGANGYEAPQQKVAQGFNGNPNVVQENVQQQQTPAQTAEEQNIYYDEMAAQAIKAGADPEKVKQKLAELRGKR